MRTLSLPVDDSIADSYDSASQLKKKKINSAINMLLVKFLEKQHDAALLNAMDELSDEASKNGLTIEKLGQLMEWDEETMKNLFGEEHHN